VVLAATGGWDVVTAIATAAAALVAGWAAIAASKSAKQTADIVTIESARREDEIAARLVADVIAYTGQRQRRGFRGERPDLQNVLIVANNGPALARQVTLTHGERPGMVEPLEGMTMHPGQKFELYYTAGGSEHGPDVEITLSWEDDRGPQSKTLVVRLLH